MSRKKVLLSVSASAIVASAFVATEDVSASSYKVSLGDSLWKIAEGHGVSVANLKKWNHLQHDLVFPNQVLQVVKPVNKLNTNDATKEVTNNKSDSEYYTVSSGDTLSEIAFANNISTKKLMDSNNLNSTLIFPGNLLSIPEADPKPETKSSETIHTVVAGDTLSHLAVEYDTTSQDIADLNKMKLSDVIHVGDKLTIDGEKRAESSKVEVKPEAKEEPKAEPKPEAKEEPVAEPEEKTEPEPAEEPEAEPEESAEPEPVEEPEAEPEESAEPEPVEEPEAEPEENIEPEPEEETEAEPEKNIEPEPEEEPEAEPEESTEPAPEEEPETEPEENIEPEPEAEPEESTEPEPAEEAEPEESAEPATEEEPEAESDESANASTYVVKSGDTLAKIASAHGTTAAKIVSLSGINQTDTLHIGDKLTVDGEASSTSSNNDSSNNNSNANSDSVTNTSNDSNTNTEPKAEPKPEPKPEPESKPKPPANTGYSANQLMSSANSVVGTKYVWGGTTQSGGFDCSGFIHWAYNDAGKEMSRTSTDGYYSRSYEISKSELQVGDLVFFAGTYRPGISHMGIYIGGNQFIHASTSAGVTTTSLDNSYWSQHFDSYKRFY